VALVVLDASVIIAFVDQRDAHHSGAVAAFTTHQADDLVVPASAYAEALFGPFRRGKTAVALLEQFIVAFAIRIEPLSVEIARQAADLRSQHLALKLPDALVLATGDALNASIVLTADRSWSKFSSRSRLI
jgi:predicted nucleic acid-binding protein